MAQGETTITIVGTIVADPELRFTPSGAAVANFRIASNPRVYNKNTNQHEDGDPLFLTCNVWRDQAENLAESLQKGMRVIVSGNLRQRSYETREGEKRTVYEVEVEEVGPSLKWATAKVTKSDRRNGGGPQRGGQQSGQFQQAQPSGQFGGGQQGGGWGNTPADDEPPF